MTEQEQLKLYKTFFEQCLLHVENREDVFKIASRLGFLTITDKLSNFRINGINYRDERPK